ncbi:MFS transporter, partial [Chloroflexota bacterium]
MTELSSQKDKIVQNLIKSTQPAWIAVAIICTIQATEGFVLQGIPILYPFIQNKMALSSSQIGVISSALLLIGTVTCLLGGWLADVQGVRKVLAFTLFSVAALMFIFPLVNSFEILLILAAIIGAIAASIYPTTTRAIKDSVPQRILGLIMSLKQSSFMLGGAIIAAILPTLAI